MFIKELNTLSIWIQPNSPIRLLFLCILICPSLLLGAPLELETSAFSSPPPAISLLSGSYDLGGGSNDFSSFTDALTQLTTEGVSGPTTIIVYPGTYDESLFFSSIPGTSPVNWIEFVSSHPDSIVTITSVGAANTAVVTFSGASYIRFDGISVSSLGDPGQRALMIEDGCSNIEFLNGEIRGSGTSPTTSYAIESLGTASDSLLFESLFVTNAADALHLTSSSTSAVDTRITNCVIDSVFRGIYLEHQHGLIIEGCNIQPNAGSTLVEIDGVYIGALSSSDTVSIRSNRFHDFVTSNSRAVAVKIVASATTALVRVYNNFIYGFANTGGSQIRAIEWSSGLCEIYSNSIYINDVSATGGSYCIHHNSFNPSLVAKFRNNILFNDVQTGVAYCFFIQSSYVTVDSDYNIFHGTGTGYVLGWCGNANRPDLSSWQSCSGNDMESLEGDPVFTDLDNLHLASSGGLAHQNGTSISYISTDIDDDERNQPPDRGADEYGYIAPPADFAVIELTSSCTICPELANVTVDAVIQNRGSAAQSGVQTRVYYQGNPRAEILIALSPLETDTFTLVWSTGFAPSSGELMVQTELDGDANPEDNTLSIDISVLGQPLQGEYQLGGQNADFATFADAMQALSERGVSDTVTFSVASGTYNESVIIPRIIGIAPDRPVEFRKSIHTEGPVNIISNTGPATVVLDSAVYIKLDGISIEAVEPNPIALLLQREASFNTVCNSSVKSYSPEVTSTFAVRTIGGGCHGNRFEDLTASNSYHGFKLHGSSSNPDSHAVVESCTIFNSVRGLELLLQKDCRILHNTISPGFEANNFHSYGIYVASLLEGDSALIEGNTIASGIGLYDAHGIFSATGAGLALIINNFVTDWNINGNGSVFGIQIGTGTAKVYHNSILMTDIPGTAAVYGLSINGSSTFMDARNNAVVIDECDSRAFCWKYQNGTLESQNNAYYSPCQSDSFSFALFGIDSVYQTLSEWADVRALDTLSFVSDPGFESIDDLHIKPFMSALNSAGEPLVDVTSDIDGELRGDPPDIGADEYDYFVPDADYSVNWNETPPSQFSALTTYQFEVVVTNLGAIDQIDVPIQLLYNDAVQSEQLVSLLDGETLSILLDWTTPDAELAGGMLSARSLLLGDLIPGNDRVDHAVIVAGAPMIGTYQIGGGTSDFASLGQAVQSLEIRGVQGPVTIELFPGDYFETVSISSIPGASEFAKVVVVPQNSDTTSVCIKSSIGKAVVTFDGAHDLHFEGINLVASGSCKGALAVRMNSLRNYVGRACLTGPDSVNIELFGAHIEVRNCDDNQLDRLSISGAYTGISLRSDETGFQAHNTLIENCTILHARYGIYVDDQVGCIIRNNEIVPGSSSSLSAACYGIYITHLQDGGSVAVDGNRIHGFADASGGVSNRATGIYSSPAAGGVVTISNNFIYDFSAVQTLKITGIYLSVGENNVYHNSILLDDGPSTNEISGILILAGQTNDIRNNNIVSLESDVRSYGIWALGGTADTSDFNNYYGTSPLFYTGAVGATEYETLSEWHETGFDSNSVALDPHYIADNDLHLDTTFPDFDNLGDETVPVTVDIDGEPRGIPPDIGADEFEFVLIPDPPQNLTLSVEETNLVIRWAPSADAQSYHVHAGDSLNFVPDGSNRITTTADTFYVYPLPPDELSFILIIADSTPLPPE